MMQTTNATALSGHSVTTAVSDSRAASIARSFYAEKVEGQASLPEPPAIVTPSTVVKLSRNAQLWQQSEARFEKFQARISPYARNFFTRDDRRVIGEAYEAAGGKPGILESSGKNEWRMKEVDKLVGELAAYRIMQHSRGELVMVAVRQALSGAEDEGEEGSKKENIEDDTPPQVDLAHMKLLGKIRELTGAGTL